MKKLLPLSALALVIALGGCKNPFFGDSSKESTTENKEHDAATEAVVVNERPVDQISAEELEKKMEKDGQKVVVINVLNENNFHDSHIRGSINIPLAELKEKAPHLDKNIDYVVYCASTECPLSKEAFHILKDHDIKNVHAFEGGMKEWKEKGLAVEGGVEHADHQK